MAHFGLSHRYTTLHTRTTKNVKITRFVQRLARRFQTFREGLVTREDPFKSVTVAVEGGPANAERSYIPEPSIELGAEE